MNPLSMVYIAPIITITPPPGCERFYYTDFFLFLKAVGSNGRPRHSQFPYAPASFSEFGKHYSYVASGKNHFILKPLRAPNVALTYVRGGSSLSVRVLASTPMLGIPLDAGSGACSLRGTPATVLVVLTILCRWRFVLGVSTFLLCHRF